MRTREGSCQLPPDSAQGEEHGWRRSLTPQPRHETGHVGQGKGIALGLDLQPETPTAVAALRPPLQQIGLIRVQHPPTPPAPMSPRGWFVELQVVHNGLATHPQTATDLVLLEAGGP